ncbi:unnamed protein product [Trichogramma brassicae]|uniref:Uncharacterized protein n=1 Tax=Trichogramma brassicae TaxID=86971 RepID=A0A6H5I8H9_9HYME|nr:unnamed protein product [Trichogramma brassicae]
MLNDSLLIRRRSERSAQSSSSSSRSYHGIWAAIRSSVGAGHLPEDMRRRWQRHSDAEARPPGQEFKSDGSK